MMTPAKAAREISNRYGMTGNREHDLISDAFSKFASLLENDDDPRTYKPGDRVRFAYYATTKHGTIVEVDNTGNGYIVWIDGANETDWFTPNQLEPIE